jgi:hypothetical protein
MSKKTLNFIYNETLVYQRYRQSFLDSNNPAEAGLPHSPSRSAMESRGQ